MTRVTSAGIVKLEFSVITTGMSKFGFSEKYSNGTVQSIVY